MHRTRGKERGIVTTRIEDRSYKPKIQEQRNDEELDGEIVGSLLQSTELTIQH
jgi:hypothetical protein